MKKVNIRHILVVTLLAALTAAGEEHAFMRPAQYTSIPLPEHAVTNRAFQGISSIAVSPKGRIWATWYAGVTPNEDQNNYVVLSTSGDNGQTWTEVLVVDPDGAGSVRTFDPEIWMAPDGKLRLFWAQTVGHQSSIGGVWMMQTETPEDEQAAWSKPRRITDGVMMCKPTVIKSGEWLMPASTWRETDNSAKCLVSRDNGENWELAGGCNVPTKERSFDEHMIVERKDGTLWLLVRTNYGIGESVSSDGGKTWPELTPSTIAHPSARFFIRRLMSGNLLLVKHGPITTRTGRSDLTAFISKDDGKTWQGGLMLDERAGVSYPDGQQTADGTIYITYDYKRTTDRNIFMALFKEEDVVAGNNVSGAVRMRQVISKASGGKEIEKPTVNQNIDGEQLITENPGKWDTGKYKPFSFKSGALLFTDRKYMLDDSPEQLRTAVFVQIAMNGSKTLNCAEAGVLYILTPVPGRNSDSCTEQLLKQGFKKVKLPEVRLFDPLSPSNLCTLYQKQCSQGETITFGKWALPLMR